MDRVIIFTISIILITVISWRTIFNLKSHGFYRYISWLCIAWLFATNYKHWFDSPFSALQLLSWVLLFISAYFVLAGVFMMKKSGSPKQHRNENNLYAFEKTTELVDTGIFKYIRHPLYSSLIFLTWGIFFKNPTIELLIISFISTIFMILTALFDEKECISFFGEKYIDYIKRSKMFVPYII